MTSVSVLARSKSFPIWRDWCQLRARATVSCGLAHQPDTVHLHGLLGHLARHPDEISCDVDRIPERHRGLARTRGRKVAVRDGQLPHHGAEPLLGRAQICGLALGTDEGPRERDGKLPLQLGQPLRRAIQPRLVPEPDELLVEWPVDVDEVYEAGDLDALARNLVERRHRDGVAQREGVMPLQGISSTDRPW